MTIEELLSNACEYANLAVISSSQSNDTRALFAQIAQAYALTAQAIILAKCTSTLAGAKTRVFMVDTGN